MPSAIANGGATTSSEAPEPDATREKPEATKRKRGLTVKQVDKQLKNLGLNPEEVNLCLKAGM